MRGERNTVGWTVKVRRLIGSKGEVGKEVVEMWARLLEATKGKVRNEQEGIGVSRECVK